MIFYSDILIALGAVSIVEIAPYLFEFSAEVLGRVAPIKREVKTLVFRLCQEAGSYG